MCNKITSNPAFSLALPKKTTSVAIVALTVFVISYEAARSCAKTSDVKIHFEFLFPS